MADWTETEAEPVRPMGRLRRFDAVSQHGAIGVMDAGPSPSGTFDAGHQWACHARFDLCWTTEARARRIGEMALAHLRELEAEIRLMDALPENASEVQP